MVFKDGNKVQELVGAYPQKLKVCLFARPQTVQSLTISFRTSLNPCQSNNSVQKSLNDTWICSESNKQARDVYQKSVTPGRSYIFSFSHSLGLSWLMENGFRPKAGNPSPYRPLRRGWPVSNSTWVGQQGEKLFLAYILLIAFDYAQNNFRPYRFWIENVWWERLNVWSFHVWISCRRSGI